jgi:hypothetical protein
MDLHSADYNSAEELYVTKALRFFLKSCFFGISLPNAALQTEISNLA